MKTAKLVDDEVARIQALIDLQVLDTEADADFDEIVKAISIFCEAPIALISLVDETRQWFKAKVGLTVEETPREISFCSHTILHDEVMEIPDARDDVRFEDNPLVTGHTNIIFYAGAPLTTSNGQKLGTLCVIDHKARKLTDSQKLMLKALANQVVCLIELKHKVYKLKKYTKFMEEIQILNSLQSDDPIKLFQDYLAKGCSVLDMELGIFGRIQDETFTVQQAVGVFADELQNLSLPLKETFCMGAVEKQATVHYSEIGKHDLLCYHPVHTKMGIESFIGTPIYFNHKMYGTLSFSSRKVRKNGWDEEDIRFIEIQAQLIAHRIELWEMKKLHQETKISEKRLEQENLLLEESFTKFQTLSDFAPVGIFLTDASGSTTYVNPYWLKITGLTFSEAMGNGWTRAIHSEDKDTVFKAWIKAATLDKMFEQEIRFQHSETGKISTVISRARLLKNEEGKVLGYIGVNIDITEEKKTEENLILAIMNAKNASNAKSRFLANMSHEIRTPLNSIIGFACLLSETSQDEEQKNYTSFLQSSSEVLLNIVNDILDISKIESDEVSLKENEIDLRDVFESTAKLYMLHGQKKNILFSSTIEDDLTTKVLADHMKIGQILINILGNAFKFIERGDVHLSLGKNNTARKGNYLFTIRDTGIGIPEKLHDTIFKAFTQAESPLSKKYAGTGLGLTISKRLVQLMGGEIWLESTGQGSTFFFTLSLKENSTNPVDVVPALSVLKPYDLHTPLKILLVDDAPNNRNLVLAYLKSFPFSITQAENGLIALELMKTQSFDLVLMDIQMPEMDGFTATQLYREWEVTNSRSILKIIAVTAFAMEEDKQKCLSSGFDLHLAKPLKKNVLLEEIDKIFFQNEPKKISYGY